MPLSSSPGLIIASAIAAFACAAVGGCRSGDETAKRPAEHPKDAGAPPGKMPVYADAVARFLDRAPIAEFEKELARWAQGRAFEKLAVAEALLHSLASEKKCGTPEAYQCKPGTDDLSRVAGRARWGLERLLGVSLPNVRPDSSPQQLEELREGASLLVEAYRKGLTAAIADYQLSPERLARLKQRYAGKIAPAVPQKAYEQARAIDDLLSQWPPIGRNLDDLVSIVGATGETREGSADGDGGVCYRFGAGPQGRAYIFIVRDGIIRSVHIRGPE